jgi:hypothetical protein
MISSHIRQNVHLQITKKEVMRMEYKILPIHVSWSENVETWVIEETVNGIRRLIGKIGVQIPNIIMGGTFQECDPKYFLSGNEQKIINISSLEIPPYAFAYTPLSTLQRNSTRLKQKKFHYIFIVSKMLFTIFPTEPYFFKIAGYGQPRTGFVMTSHTILESLSCCWQEKILARNDPTIKKRAIRRLAAHEYGHILGLTGGTQGYKKGFPEATHCKNSCIMNVHKTTFVQKVIDDERAGVFLCKDCINELKIRLKV